MKGNLNIIRAFNMLRKYFLLTIIFSSLSSLTLLIISKQVMVPEYRAVTQLVGKNTTEMQENLNDANYKLLMINTYKSLAKSYAVLNGVVKFVNDNTGRKSTVEQLQGAITISQEEDSQIFNIYAVDSDPEIAKLIARTTADSMVKNVGDLLGKENKVSIISPAVVSYTPISPNTKLNTVIGFLLGMFLSVFVIYLKSLYDSTLDGDDEIEKQLGLVSLGSVSNIKDYVKTKDITYLISLQSKQSKQSNKARKEEKHGKVTHRRSDIHRS